MWRLALSDFWLLTLLEVAAMDYLFISVWISYINHLHTWALSDSAPPDHRRRFTYKPLFPAFFSQFLDLPPLMDNTCSYTIQSPCVFSVRLIWAFINNSKHRHLEFLLLIPMEKKHFLPCIQLHFAPQQWRLVQTTWAQEIGIVIMSSFV